MNDQEQWGDDNNSISVLLPCQCGHNTVAQVNRVTNVAETVCEICGEPLKFKYKGM